MQNIKPKDGLYRIAGIPVANIILFLLAVSLAAYITNLRFWMVAVIAGIACIAYYFVFMRNKIGGDAIPPQTVHDYDYNFEEDEEK